MSESAVKSQPAYLVRSMIARNSDHKCMSCAYAVYYTGFWWRKVRIPREGYIDYVTPWKLEQFEKVTFLFFHLKILT